ncbi:MAG: hypothetical protein GY906_11490 [bacterium]|nr:hypothetical protein [bacterium]
MRRRSVIGRLVLCSRVRVERLVEALSTPPWCWTCKYDTRGHDRHWSEFYKRWVHADCIPPSLHRHGWPVVQEWLDRGVLPDGRAQREAEVFRVSRRFSPRFERSSECSP